MEKNCSSCLFYLIACIVLGIGLFLPGIYFVNEGLFTGWVSVGDPLPKATHILSSSHDGWVWVTTQDGLVYRSSNAHPTWVVEKDFPGKNVFLVVQNGSCRFSDEYNLGFLQHPPGRIIECARYVSATDFGLDMTFYALSEGGTVWKLQLRNHTEDSGWIALFWWIIFTGLSVSIVLFAKRKQIKHHEDQYV